MEIRNIEGLSVDDVNKELERGAKFVVFEYCFSVIIMTFKRSSDIYLIREGESSIKYSISFTLITLFLGWWGIPWGPIYSIGSLYTNLIGGKDITQEIINSFNTENESVASTT